jgi:hypothetical protein
MSIKDALRELHRAVYEHTGEDGVVSVALSPRIYVRLCEEVGSDDPARPMVLAFSTGQLVVGPVAPVAQFTVTL